MVGDEANFSSSEKWMPCHITIPNSSPAGTYAVDIDPSIKCGVPHGKHVSGVELNKLRKIVAPLARSWQVSERTNGASPAPTLASFNKPPSKEKCGTGQRQVLKRSDYEATSSSQSVLRGAMQKSR